METSLKLSSCLQGVRLFINHCVEDSHQAEQFGEHQRDDFDVLLDSLRLQGGDEWLVSGSTDGILRVIELTRRPERQEQSVGNQPPSVR